MQIEVMTTLLIAVGGAAWAITTFLLRRDAQPGAELHLDVEFAGRQHGQYVIEIVATLTNRGFVRHRYRNMRVIVRYLGQADAIVDGSERIGRQTLFPHSIDDRIGGVHRLFANVEYIDPRLTFRHSYVTFVPADATFVLVSCSLEFPTIGRWRPKKKNAQRLFRVPAAIP